VRPRKGSNNTNKTDIPSGARVEPIYLNYVEEFSRKGPKTLKTEPEEAWVNETYCVHATLREDGSVRRLSIRRRDWAAIRDWRDLQAIKNQICGPECEAAELYPAESSVLDTLNWFHLWVLPPGERFPFGFRYGDKREGTSFNQRPLERRTDSTPLVRAKERTP
jgi:hypothetical protein